VSDDDLPNPMEPGTSVNRPASSASPALPKGDVRVASWIALISGAIVVLWYLSILILGGIYLAEFSSPLQYAIWGLALVSFVCGVISLNARRARELAAAGFISGVVSLLVSLTIGLPTGFQIVF
jgi:hypothetical protein